MFDNKSIIDFADSKSENLKELLKLPFEITEKDDFATIIKGRMDDFVNELAIPYFEEVCRLDKNSIPVKRLTFLVDGIIKVLRTEECKYQELKTILDDIKYGCLVYKKQITNRISLFRARETQSLDEKEFYHQPFNMESKKDGRFNSSGEIGWYLGESESVCKLEVEGEVKIKKISLKTEGDYFLQVADLTAESLYLMGAEMSSQIENELSLFPLVLACYCYSESRKDIYQIPQLLAHYIRENASSMNIHGIQYFTVRNEALNPSECEYKNICLFPQRQQPNDDYDLRLMKMFRFEDI